MGTQRIPSRWVAGDQILLRGVWEDHVFVAIPVTVIVDQPDLLALYLSTGSPLMRAYTQTGVKARLPIGDLELQQDVWRTDAIRFCFPDIQYAILGFYDDLTAPPSRWYVNIERSYSRTPLGVDFTDHFLDIRISGDLSAWSWKDADELVEATQIGLITTEHASEIRAAGEHAVKRLGSRAAPFDGSWDRWRPPESPPILSLPTGWETV